MSALLQLLLACPSPSAYVEKPADSGEVSDTGADADTSDTAGDSAAPEDTSELLDQDDDGYRPLDGDCDDHLPHVHPGADDFCDALDQDCDGEPIPDGSCSAGGDITKMWSWALVDTETLTGWFQERAGDVDGDGLLDLTVDVTNVSDPELATVTHGTLFGKDWSGRQGATAYPEGGFDEGWPVLTYGNQAQLGDLDQDGFDEMVVYTRDTEYQLGGVFLYYGSAEGWPERGPRLDESADAMWWADGDAYTLDVVGPGDFDGDGHDDLWLHTLYLEGSGGANVLVPGSLVRCSGSTSLLDAELLPSLGAWGTLADLDGDGSSELYGSAGYTGAAGLWVFEGEDLEPAANVSDLLHFSTYEGELSDQPPWPLGGHFTRSADLNRDGYNDLGVGPRYLEGGCVSLRSGGIPEGNVVEGEFARICGLAENALNSDNAGWVPDFDGDGEPELLMGASTFIPSTRIAPGGTVEASEVCAPCFDIEAENSGFVRAVGDMTGDGLPEFAAMITYDDGDPGYDADNLYATAIVLGFDIPWDDPSKW